jgi:hypothetical protein
MNPKEDIISILEDSFRRENFILTLKNLDKNSDIFQIHTNTIVEDLKLKQPPILQNNVLQNMFQFFDLFFCFSDLRLVCKSWKFAIETIRFSEKGNGSILSKLVKKYPNINYPTVFEKYFNSLQHLDLGILAEVDGEVIENKEIQGSWPSIKNLLLENTYNLKIIDIDLPRELCNDSTFFDPFLRKHKNTITHLGIFLHANVLPNDIKFTNLDVLRLSICEQAHFYILQKIIEHGPYWERLENMDILFDKDMEKIPEEFSNFIITHYSKKCIYSEYEFPFDYLPIKIYSGFEIEKLSKTKFGTNVEYIFFNVGSVEEINEIHEHNWQNFEIEFKKMKNLKGICIREKDDWIYTETELFNDDKILFMRGLTNESVKYLQKFAIFIKTNLKVKILDEYCDYLLDDLSKNSYRFEFSVME